MTWKDRLVSVEYNFGVCLDPEEGYKMVKEFLKEPIEQPFRMFEHGLNEKLELIITLYK